jgi:Rod binding domain-containing protein
MTDAIPLPGAPLPMSTANHPQPRRAEGTPENRRVAEQFESMFLTEMLGPMFEGLSTDGVGGGGIGEEVFRPMLVEKYAEAITHAGGVGIADSILRELTRMQAASAAPQTTEEPHGADR